jgi:hypothetical protein
VSNPESFIDEVTEEVRRDRLFAMFRRYGWIGALVVAAVVGGTAWTEWTRAREEARAQGFGDALIEALDQGGAEARRAAIAAVPVSGPQQALQALILASDPDQDRAATLAALATLEGDAAQPQVYRDLAGLRRAMLAGSDLPVADRRATLEALAAPGRAFRTLAEEQLAYLEIEEGRSAEAIARLRKLLQDQEATPSLRSRASQMIVALGGDPAQG